VAAVAGEEHHLAREDVEGLVVLGLHVQRRLDAAREELLHDRVVGALGLDLRQAPEEPERLTLVRAHHRGK
jgi:hypothetical protein